MILREQFEKEEHERLSPYAAFADMSKGRNRQEEESDMRTCFQRDRDRIIHCKSFRRLKHKTQVFLAPYGDHYRTRLTHTLEVSQIARSMAKALRLNEELTEAIALGHDIGHTPFGHAGERALERVTGRKFSHNMQSVRVVERLENSGKGLNLTKEVLDGMMNHKTSLHPATCEGNLVRISDKIAYINHDIDDGIRAGVFTEEELPKACTDVLGRSTRDRINTIIHDVIEHSMGKSEVSPSDEVWEALIDLRKYMFATLYRNPIVKGEEVKAERIVEILYEHYLERPHELPEEYRRISMEEDGITAVTDYIAGMTDNYATQVFQELFVPHFWTRV